MSFFIVADDSEGQSNTYYMDATVSINYRSRGNPTKYAVESGADVSDHYRQEPDQIISSGYISKVKFIREGSGQTDLEIFQAELTALKRSGKFFKVGYDINSPLLHNCLFSSLEFKWDTSTGKYALKADFTIEQVIVADQAKLTASPVPADQHKDMVEEKKTGKGSTTEPKAEEQGYLMGVIDDLTAERT